MTVRLSLKPVKDLYGHLPAREFGPLALKAVRQRFAGAGLSRAEVNRRARAVRRVFKWAAAAELVPVAVFQALTCVEGLRKGRCDLWDPRPVGPVAEDGVRATLPHLTPVVAAMVEVQLLTGMRPGEVCRLQADVLVREPSW